MKQFAKDNNNQNEDGAGNNRNFSNNSRAISRLRQLVAQPSIDNVLDNEFNNYPQNQNDLEIGEQERLFEEYIQESSNQNHETFDSELATLHKYLGETENVKGLKMYEAYKTCEVLYII